MVAAPSEHVARVLRWRLHAEGLRCRLAPRPRLRSLRLRLLLPALRATFESKHAKRQLSLLTDTFFQATMLPLVNWLLAMCFLSQTNNRISALDLGRRVEINDNIAWLLKHKLVRSMRERDRRRRFVEWM